MENEKSGIEWFVVSVSKSYTEELKRYVEFYESKSIKNKVKIEDHPNYDIIIDSSDDCFLNYDEDLDLAIYGEKGQLEIFESIKQLYALQLKIEMEYENYCGSSATDFQIDLIRTNLEFRLHHIKEVSKLLKSKLSEIEPFPLLSTSNKESKVHEKNIRRKSKINVRLSIYELAYVCTVLKSMRLITDYVGRKFDKRFIAFIEDNFMCLDAKKTGFVSIKDFRSTLSKVMRDVSYGRNEKIKEKQEEILTEAFKTVGEYLEKYSKVQLIDTEKG